MVVEDRMAHWTAAQQWQELVTHEGGNASQLIQKYGDYLRKHKLSLCDYPKGNLITMLDGTIWYRI